MYNSDYKLRFLHGLRLSLFKKLFLDTSNPFIFLLKIFYFSYLISLSPHECLATYREHLVENEKICPDPLHSHSSTGVSEEFPKETLLVNLPKTLSLFESVNDFPCNFASSTHDNNLRKVIVRAIHPSTSSWNYTTAQNCDYFIKFKSESHHNKLHSAHSHKNEVICRVWKQHDEEFSREGSFYHPMIWNSPNNKMTLSFSHDWEYKLENNNTVLYKPTYLLMVFLVYGDGDSYCSLRVQQYLIDPMENLKRSCNSDSSTMETYQHCGMYECTELKSILQSIRFRTYEIDDVEIANRKRLHEEQQKELERLQNNQSNNSNNTNNSNTNSSQHNENGSDTNHIYPTSRSNDLSTIEQYDIFKTTTKTINFYNGSNSLWTNLSVSSIMIVPIIALILTIFFIRCYIKKCKSGYSAYDECENANLIVPSDHRHHHHHHQVNTHVTEDGNVELDLDYDADAMPLYSSEQFSDSMDYIQPIDIRNMTLSIEKSPAISDPPSYETLAETFGPPHYPGYSSDAVII